MSSNEDIHQNSRHSASRSNLVYMNYEESQESQFRKTKNSHCQNIPPNLREEGHKNRVYLKEMPKQEAKQQRYQFR
jgi:hypothetical protein